MGEDDDVFQALDVSDRAGDCMEVSSFDGCASFMFSIDNKKTDEWDARFANLQLTRDEAQRLARWIMDRTATNSPPTSPEQQANGGDRATPSTKGEGR